MSRSAVPIDHGRARQLPGQDSHEGKRGDIHAVEKCARRREGTHLSDEWPAVGVLF
jgi:hypothetical protein